MQLRTRALALAMAQHERVGRDSPAGLLTCFLARDIAVMAFRARKIYAIAGQVDPSGNLTESIEEYDEAGDACARGVVYVSGGMAGGQVTSVDTFCAQPDGALGLARASSVPELKNARWLHASASLRGSVAVVGGFSSTQGNLASLELLDPQTGVWSDGPALPVPREGTQRSPPLCPQINCLAAAECEGGLYALGGCSGPMHSLVDRYDGASGAWVKCAPLPEARRVLGAASLGGCVWAVGGQSDAMSSSTRTDCYDAASDRWLQGPHLPEGKHSLAVVAFGGRVVAMGGATKHSASSKDVWALDPRAGRWDDLCSLVVPRAWHTAAVID
eukprot:m51a1_g1027 hypothetical protein (330) ;mRNA; f:658742-660022